MMTKMMLLTIRADRSLCSVIYAASIILACWVRSMASPAFCIRFTFSMSITLSCIAPAFSWAASAAL